MKGIKNYLTKAACFVLAYLSMIGVAGIAGLSVTGIDILQPLLFVLFVMIYDLAIRAWKCSEKKVAVIFSAVFSLSVVLGSKMKVYDGIFENFSVLDFFYFIVLFLLFAAIVTDVLYLALKYDNKLFQTTKKGEKGTFVVKTFWIICGLYLLCWLPYYLSVFPGNLGADTFESVSMGLGLSKWTNHQPVLFSLLLKLVVDMTGVFHNLTASLAVFTFLHMLVIAGMLSYFTIWMYQRISNRVCRAGIFCFFAFHPIVAMYSMYITKDVMFSTILLIFTIKLYELVESKGKWLEERKQCVCLSVLSILTALLRNNGLYIILVLFLVLLITYRRYYKQLLLILFSVLVLTGIYKGPIFHALGIEKESFAEAASIPLQQIGYVIWEDGEISKEDGDFLEELMPLSKVKQVYDPGYTDPYKFDEEFNDDFLNQNKGKFLTVWWNLFLSHPDSYVKAYLMQTAGYWHYGETNSVCTQSVAENTFMVKQVDIIQSVTGVSLMPVIEKLVLAARKAPLLCILSSMAMQMFAVLFLVLLYCRNGKKEYVIPLILFIVLWGTVMIASPAFCLLRYLYPVFLSWPLLFTEIMENLVKKEV